MFDVYISGKYLLVGSCFNNLGKKRKICHLHLQLEWRNTTQAVSAGLESKGLNRQGELQRKKEFIQGLWEK